MKKTKRKRPSAEECEEHVMDTIEELKEKHGSNLPVCSSGFGVR